jgi:ATP-binding cassette subfamily B multidrug efflux pump
MFFMRQTIIVMSRHIEYDQKNEIYPSLPEIRYQFLQDTQHRRPDEPDDGRCKPCKNVYRPCAHVFCQPVTLIGFCVVNMLRKDVHLTLLVLAPLPILAITIYLVNSVINKKSEKIQALLSDLTTNAQESFSGIRVIKSFVQEKAMLGFFKKNSQAYKKMRLVLPK